MKKFIVMECGGGPEYTTIVTDEEGNNKVFDNMEDAIKEAQECQLGRVIEFS